MGISSIFLQGSPVVECVQHRQMMLANFRLHFDLARRKPGLEFSCEDVGLTREVALLFRLPHVSKRRHHESIPAYDLTVSTPCVVERFDQNKFVKFRPDSWR